MNIEEKRKIEEMYEKGLVEISSIIEPLIENFKIDRCSIDIQQCQLVIDYLIRDRDFDENYIQQLEAELEKEKELLELASNMLDNIDYDQIPIAIGELKSELEKEKEKVESFEYALLNGEVTTINKFDNNVPTKLIGSYTHGKEVVNFIKRNFVSKNKLKEIIYPTPNRPIPIEIQQSEMYKKLAKEVEE